MRHEVILEGLLLLLGVEHEQDGQGGRAHAGAAHDPLPGLERAVRTGVDAGRGRGLPGFGRRRDRRRPVALGDALVEAVELLLQRRQLAGLGLARVHVALEVLAGGREIAGALVGLRDVVEEGGGLAQPVGLLELGDGLGVQTAHVILLAGLVVDLRRLGVGVVGRGRTRRQRHRQHDRGGQEPAATQDRAQHARTITRGPLLVAPPMQCSRGHKGSVPKEEKCRSYISLRCSQALQPRPS
jgi:hypothetical protein